MAKRKKRNSTTIDPLIAEEHNPFIEAYEASCFTNKPKIQEHEKERIEEYRWLASFLKLNEEETESFVINELRVNRFVNKIKQPLATKIKEAKADRARGGSKTKLLNTEKEILLLRLVYQNHRGTKRQYERMARELRERHGIKKVSAKTVSRRLRELGISDNASVVPEKNKYGGMQAD